MIIPEIPGVVGVDECGRGALCGNVTTAAVVLPAKSVLDQHPLAAQIRDSKKLSKKKRDELAAFIKEIALAWAIGEASPAEIDQQNILQATMTAAHRALDKVTEAIPNVTKIVMDGTYFRPYKGIPYECIVGGDDAHLSIAAASILAKTHRDDAITAMCVETPELSKYGLATNMGYATKTHRDAIKTHGYVEGFHRKSFLRNLLPPS